MLYRTASISISIQAAALSCCFRRCRRQLVSSSVRTFATRRPTTTTRDQGEGRPDNQHDPDHDPDIHAGSWPHPIYASARSEAKKSIFVAHASRFSSASPTSLRVFLDHLTAQPALKRATHCMYAWRIVVSQSGSETSKNADTKTELADSGPGTILTGQSDGGESGAGERLARLLEVTGSTNVIVVVSRWYGGVKLGSERWKLISSVAKDALAQGSFREGDSNKSSTGTDTNTTLANAKGSNNKKNRKK